MRRLGFGFFLVRARKNALLVPAICVAGAVLAHDYLIRLNCKFATNGPWGELMGTWDL